MAVLLQHGFVQFLALVQFSFTKLFYVLIEMDAMEEQSVSFN